jgi:hypothetical protein
MTEYTQEGKAIHHRTLFNGNWIDFVPMFSETKPELANKIICDMCNKPAKLSDKIIESFGKEKHIHKECKEEN